MKSIRWLLPLSFVLFFFLLQVVAAEESTGDEPASNNVDCSEICEQRIQKEIKPLVDQKENLSMEIRRAKDEFKEERLAQQSQHQKDMAEYQKKLEEEEKKIAESAAQAEQLQAKLEEAQQTERELRKTVDEHNQRAEEHRKLADDGIRRAKDLEEEIAKFAQELEFERSWEGVKQRLGEAIKNWFRKIIPGRNNKKEKDSSKTED